jgi:hypothetical protein
MAQLPAVMQLAFQMELQFLLHKGPVQLELALEYLLLMSSLRRSCTARSGCVSPFEPKGHLHEQEIHRALQVQVKARSGHTVCSKSVSSRSLYPTFHWKWLEALESAHPPNRKPLSMQHSGMRLVVALLAS